MYLGQLFECIFSNLRFWSLAFLPEINMFVAGFAIFDNSGGSSGIFFGCRQGQIAARKHDHVHSHDHAVSVAFIQIVFISIEFIVIYVVIVIIVVGISHHGGGYVEHA